MRNGKIGERKEQNQRPNRESHHLNSLLGVLVNSVEDQSVRMKVYKKTSEIIVKRH